MSESTPTVTPQQLKDAGIDVDTLGLQHGDIFVITVPEPLPSRATEAVRKCIAGSLRKYDIHVPVLVLSCGATAQVLRLAKANK